MALNNPSLLSKERVKLRFSKIFGSDLANLLNNNLKGSRKAYFEVLNHPFYRGCQNYSLLQPLIPGHKITEL